MFPVNTHRFGVVLRLLVIMAFSLVLMWSLSSANGFAQQGYGAQAMAVAMAPPLRAMDRAPYAAAPASGGSASDSSVQYAIEGLGLVDLPLVTAGGSGAGSSVSANATAWTSGVNLFGGQVRVSSLRVNASANSANGPATASGDVTIEGLVVDNVPIDAVALNQAIPLPGIGTVIAREVQISQDRATVTANGLRVVGDPSSGPLAGKQLIVAQAAAGIPGVPLSPPAVAAAPLGQVLLPRPPLGSLVPRIGLSNDNGSSDDNDNFDSNDNFDTNDNVSSSTANRTLTTTPTGGSGASAATVTPTGVSGTSAATATPTRATSTPEATSTPTRTPTRTPSS